MFFSQPDFVEFCVNLDYFLKQELQFQEGDTPYPIAKLRGDGETVRDITLHFNHDRDPEIARNKWNERKQRIKKDNLYIILYYLDGLTINQLKRLEKVPCKNKVVLSKEPLAEIPWSVCIKPNKRQKYASSYLGKDVFGVRHFEKHFDFVSFINHKEIDYRLL